MDEIEKLASLFAQFPGIGERQAKRFVYFLLGRDQAYTKDLIDRLGQLKKKIAQCRECYRYFPADGNEICDVCASPKTDPSMLMVVEKDSDFENVRRSKAYPGKYFILGGLVPIIDKTTTKKIRVNELLSRVETMANPPTGGGLKELVIALSLNPNGENTDSYLRQKVAALAETFKFKVTSLGRGLSTGSELEYTDDQTIKNALKNRQ